MEAETVWFEATVIRHILDQMEIESIKFYCELWDCPGQSGDFRSSAPCRKNTCCCLPGEHLPKSRDLAVWAPYGTTHAYRLWGNLTTLPDGHPGSHEPSVLLFHPSSPCSSASQLKTKTSFTGKAQRFLNCICKVWKQSPIRRNHKAWFKCMYICIKQTWSFPKPSVSYGFFHLCQTSAQVK